MKINNGKKLEILITYLPLINQLRQSKLTYQRIASIFESEFNLNFTVQELMNFVKRDKSKTLHQEFDNLILIRHVNGLQELKEVAVEFHKLFVIHKSIKNRLPQIDFEEIMINSQNLIELLEPEAMIYSKRLLRMYDTPDELLIERQNEIISVKQIDIKHIQDEIHANFTLESKQLMDSVVKNYVKFLTNNITRIYK